ncbi:hypothetical protein GPJ56_007091 [Histomonas meleagridis]|uniref:uncharacterized protein n=1 Tax=Histomonas meleagridis TaxID=135588 RepID=UPI00355993B4|nr:hypothetical protein GPJ56_007091 [Histomonas meleagridis]KAH0799804.1 hypothetical protein GO595_007525 [Histomonas meleagridis]
MEGNKNSKRNYIRRKKYLNDCITQVKATLELVNIARGEKVNIAENQKLALAHAQAIEAVCWSPHSRLSADGYQKLMNAKTNELCRTIIKKSLPVDLTQLHKIVPIIPERPQTPQPSLPVPIIVPQSAPVIHSMDSLFQTQEDDKDSFHFVASFENGNDGFGDFDESPFLSMDDNNTFLDSSNQFDSSINEDIFSI